MEAIWNHRKEWVHVEFVDRQHGMKERNGVIDYMEKQDWHSGFGNKVWILFKQDVNIIILVLWAAVRMCVIVLTTLYSPFSLVSSTCAFVTRKLGFNQRVLNLATSLRIVLSICTIL